MTDAEITFRETVDILKATGLSLGEVMQLKQTDDNLTTFSLQSPIAGTITEKHVTLGESIGEEEPAFVITDTSSVWIELSIYQKDLPKVHIGQKVVIPMGDAEESIVGNISFISPIFNHETRMATARIVIDNRDGRLKPGQFIEANIQVTPIHVEVMVPKTAVLKIGDEIVVFCIHEGEIEEHEVVLGRSDDFNIEIVSGLEEGEEYVAIGGFIIKSEMAKDSFAHAGHGH